MSSTKDENKEWYVIDDVALKAMGITLKELRKMLHRSKIGADGTSVKLFDEGVDFIDLQRQSRSSKAGQKKENKDNESVIRKSEICKAQDGKS